MLNLSPGNEDDLHSGSCDSDFKCGANQNEEYCFSVKAIGYMKFTENNNPCPSPLPKKKEEDEEQEEEA